LDYVSIDGYINRLLEVLGTEYDFIVTQSSVELLPPEMKTSTGKRLYMAQVTGQLTLHGTPPAVNQAPSLPGRYKTTRSGVGADVAFDADKAIKTAQAEALKKAAHQFGIALELWDEEHRAKLDKQRKLVGASEAVLKQEVFKIARERTGKDKPTAAEVAKTFSKKAGELADADVLRSILEAEGLI